MKPGHRAVGHRRGARAARRHALLRRVSAAPVRRGDARGRRRESARAGLRARQRRRRRQAPRRARRRETIDVTFAKELLVVVDRSSVGDDARGRLADAVGTAFREGDGDCVILFTEPVARRSTASRRRGCASPSASSARTTARARPRRRRSSSRSTARAARASAATASARCSSTTRRSSSPTPTRSLRDGAIDPWTKPRYENKRRALAEFAKTRRHLDGRAVGEAPGARSASSCCTARRAATRASSPSSSTSRRSDTSSTSASSCGSIRRRRSARTATAPSSSRRRCRCASPAARSPRSASCRSIGCSTWLDDARAARRSSGRSPRTSSRKRATACSSSATSA